MSRSSPDPGGSTAEAAEEIEASTNSLIETISDATPRVLVALGIVLVGYGLSRVVRAVLRRLFRRRQTTSFAQVMSKLGGWVFLFLVVLAAIAVTFPSVQPVDLLAGLGFFSVAVGFAFQDILENTLAGVLLLFRQPFRVGDQIEVEGQSGTVEQITIRETRLRAFGGEHVVIPNRDVYKSAIVVFTHDPVIRQEVLVGISYADDPEQAVAEIERAMRSVAGVVDEPAPVALVHGFGASTVDICAMFWADSRRLDNLRVRSDTIAAIKRHVDAAGIDMPAEIMVIEPSDTLIDTLRSRDRS